MFRLIDYEINNNLFQICINLFHDYLSGPLVIVQKAMNNYRVPSPAYRQMSNSFRGYTKFISTDDTSR